MKIEKQSAAIIVAVVMLVSVMSVGIVYSTGGVEDEIVLVRVENLSDIYEIQRHDVDILERYDTSVLIRSSEENNNHLSEAGFEINQLIGRTEISVKGHQFDINEGIPEFSDELMIDEYGSDEEGIYLVHVLGPVSSSWRNTLEDMDLELIDYVPNYAYEVRMTPEIAEKVENLDFVDWVGIYQPGFKLAEDIEPGLITVQMADGSREIIETEDMSQIEEIAGMPEVYYLFNYVEPELHGEVATQTIGGGHWIDDPDDDPYHPWRGHNDEYDYGAHVNHLGYEGEGLTVAVADTGIHPDHPDFQDRVIGGYDFTGSDDWTDGHGHGTHCAGSVAAHTYEGTGDSVDDYWDTDVEDYLVAQGMAPESELFSVRIFDDGGGSHVPTDASEVVTVARENSDAYIHTNSWGSDARGSYEGSCSDYDSVVRDAGDGEPMVITVSAGNEGEGPDYETTGSPGNAKNVITVGASEAFYPGLAEDADGYEGDPDRTAEFSSRGWTEDGRAKPDLMAPGMYTFSTYIDEDTGEWSYAGLGGTSMSNPAVAGGAALVTEWYEDLYGVRPSPALVKALMINTAYDMEDQAGDYYTGPIPNRDEGWGMVNLPVFMDASVDLMLEDQTTVLETQEEQQYEIEYQDTDEPMKLSVVWTDSEAESGANPTLRNDLNLEVETPGGEIIRGNAFDLSGDGESDDGYTYPDAEVLDNFDGSGDGWDDRNNVQNVFIPSGELEAGTYTLTVRAEDVPEPVVDGGQDYALVKYNAEEADLIPGPLEPTDPDPVDGATGVETDLELSVYAEHEDGDNMDVSFYDAADDSLIDTDNNVQSESRASIDWVNLDPATEYSWYAVADDGEETATSNTWTFTTEEEGAPSVILNRPEGGEEWNANDNEDILWETEEGDGAITGVDLELSTDGGGSWGYIAQNRDDTGVYEWNIPDESTNEARVRATVHDDNDLSTSDTSGLFTILGTPPAPPENLNVEHHGVQEGVLFEDDVSEDKGYTAETTEDVPDDGEWLIRDYGSTVGDNSWDFGGEGEYFKTEDYGYISRLTSPDIEIPEEAEEVELTFDHWRSFGDDSMYDGGNLKLSTDGGGTWQIIEPVEGYDGTIDDGFGNPLGGEEGWGHIVDWEVATFDLTEHAGETINLRWEAGMEAWDGFYGEGWRIDNILMTAEGIETDGDEHNLITWDASPDDPDEVPHYNLYRSEDEDEAGPYELITTVEADGSVSYEYVDENRGTADDTLWWYMVHAVDEQDQECEGVGPVQEPGEVDPSGPFAPIDPEPVDGATEVETSVELSVYVEHEDGDNVDVYFYDASDDGLIGEDDNVESDSRAYTTWNGLDYGTTYEWYATANDGEETATSSTWSFTTETQTPPTITVTRPEGGEEWNAGDDEEITWDTTYGDGDITGVDLEYSVDLGETWEVIAEETEDDGEYTWTIPDEPTDEAQIRGTVHDDNDLSGEDTSELFSILGTPPESPIDLTVEHHGTEGGEELLYPVEELESVNLVGEIEYLQHDPDNGAAYDNWYEETNIDDNELVVGLDVPSGDIDGLQTIGILVRRTDNSGRAPELTVELYQDGTLIDTLLTEQGIDDPTGEVHYLDFQAGDLVDTTGSGLELHFSAPRTGGPQADRNVVEYGAVEWQANVLGSDGDEDNLITWNASPDEPDVVEYNVYRSEGEDEAGPYDLIATVAADGSAEYEYVDSGRGTADDTLWWYMVHSVDEHDQECEGAGPVQEPGAELSTFEIELSADEADGWNFVSFNLDLEDNDLESILEDEDNGISGNYDKVMYYDATADEWYSYVPGRAEHFNNIDTWDHTMGIWIQMNEVDTLTVEGQEPTDTTISLEAGWNMVSYPSSEAGTGVPDQVTQIGYFDAGEEYNVAYTEEVDTFEFSPGEGYWLYAEEPTEWAVEY